MNTQKKYSEASEEYGVQNDFLIQYIEHEWIKPIEDNGLDEEDLARIRLIKELKDDFGVNDEGVSIILHLIDQLNSIRLRSKKFEK